MISAYTSCPLLVPITSFKRTPMLRKFCAQEWLYAWISLFQNTLLSCANEVCLRDLQNGKEVDSAWTMRCPEMHEVLYWNWWRSIKVLLPVISSFMVPAWSQKSILRVDSKAFTQICFKNLVNFPLTYWSHSVDCSTEWVLHMRHKWSTVHPFSYYENHLMKKTGGKQIICCIYSVLAIMYMLETWVK